MEFLTFKNGDKMPALGLGTWKSNPGEVYDAIRIAIRLGYRHFDCAAAYQNEDEIGKAFSDAFKQGDVKREELWITSKLWNANHLKKDVIPAFEKTASDLQLDYLDLYLMHWPVALKPGTGFPNSADQFIPISEAPLDETWTEMEKIYESGRVKHLGVSNFNITTLDGLMKNAKVMPEMNQVEMHPFLAQEKLVKHCQDNGLHLTAYSPLGSGDRPAERILSTEPKLMEDTTIQKIAEVHSVTPAQILLAWQVNRGVAVIPKSTNEGRLKLNLESAEIKLSDEEMKSINSIETDFRYIDGSLWTIEGAPYKMEDLWEY